jgi:hypothetical protein
MVLLLALRFDHPPPSTPYVCNNTDAARSKRWTDRPAPAAADAGGKLKSKLMMTTRCLRLFGVQLPVRTYLFVFVFLKVFTFCFSYF